MPEKQASSGVGTIAVGTLVVGGIVLIGKLLSKSKLLLGAAAVTGPADDVVRYGLRNASDGAVPVMRVSDDAAFSGSRVHAADSAEQTWQSELGGEAASTGAQEGLNYAIDSAFARDEERPERARPIAPGRPVTIDLGAGRTLTIGGEQRPFRAAPPD